MQLHCLGTAGYHPNEQRHTSCYFLPESGIVLDAGSGLFRLAGRICTPTLDIVLSHAHLDHVVGLTFLLDVLHRHPVDLLRIWGQREKLDAIREHLFSPLLFPVALETAWCPIDGSDSFRIGDCEIAWRPQDHPGDSVGYRLDWPDGTRLLYLTDTTGDAAAEAIDWYRGSDLMMHECYFGEAMRDWAEKTGHTWTGRLVEIAAAATPRQLLLTHVNPLDEQPERMLAEVQRGLAGSAVGSRLAGDGDVLEFACGG